LSHVSAEVEALSRTVHEQAAALQEASAQRHAAEERAKRLQLEADRLSNELRDTGPASDLQRQFREVPALFFIHLLPQPVMRICNLPVGDEVAWQSPRP